MSEEKTFKHEYTNEIVCPYCGYEHNDSWEFTQDNDTIECPDCEKEFQYNRIVTIEYSTSKKLCEKHNFKFTHLFESKRDYKKGQWVNKPSTYHMFFKCSVCDLERILDITKERYDRFKSKGL